MLPTFISRPILDTAEADSEAIKRALAACPLGWSVTTEHVSATDTEGTKISARLHYPSAVAVVVYDHSMGAQGNHLSAALEVLARHEIVSVALLNVDDIAGGYRFTFGPEGLD